MLEQEDVVFAVLALLAEAAPPEEEAPPPPQGQCAELHFARFLGIPHLTIYCQGQRGNRKSVFVGVPIEY